MRFAPCRIPSRYLAHSTSSKNTCLIKCLIVGVGLHVSAENFLSNFGNVNEEKLLGRSGLCTSQPKTN